MSRMERSVVVDASIARSAGTTDNPISKTCRDFLQEMQTVGHKAVFDADLMVEWRRHQSGYAIRWFAMMLSKRRVVLTSCTSAEKRYLAKLIADAQTINATDRKAAQKDEHLVRCAWASDNLVGSLDDRVRKIFAALAYNSIQLGGVVWVNPSKTEEKPIEWLKAGARTEDSRKLRNWTRH